MRPDLVPRLLLLLAAGALTLDVPSATDMPLNAVPAAQAPPKLDETAAAPAAVVAAPGARVKLVDDTAGARREAGRALKAARRKGDPAALKSDFGVAAHAGLVPDGDAALKSDFGVAAHAGLVPDGEEEEPVPVAAATKLAGDEHDGCSAWAADGECIRNPQYMWAVCAGACGSLRYADSEPACVDWAEGGECEKNPGFMFEQCNQSCVDLARRPPKVEAARKNPHQFGTGGATGHRAATFIPIFLLIAAILVCGVGLATAYGPAIERWQEQADDQLARLRVRLQRRFPALAPLIASIGVYKLGSSFICIYYMNEALTVLQTNPLFASWLPFAASDGVWQKHVAWVDATNLVGGAAAVALLLGCKPVACACAMMGDTLVDSYLLLWRILMQFVYGRGLYINELMAKKFSLLGCVALLIASAVQASQSRRDSWGGSLLDGANLSTRLSLAVLIGRLLIAVLFLFVGLSELHRLLFAPMTPYLPGDGHDVVWPKAVELLLALPFIVGWKVDTVSRLLCVSLVMEALYAWSWWNIPGDASSFAHHRRAIHYREHFVTNIGTAGGLLLLQRIGGGKYTVDELLKKKD